MLHQGDSCKVMKQAGIVKVAAHHLTQWEVVQQPANLTRINHGVAATTVNDSQLVCFTFRFNPDTILSSSRYSTA